MCDGASAARHGHGHGQSGKGLEEEPPGARLGAGKGQVFEFVRGLPSGRLAHAIHFFHRLEDVGRYGTGFYLGDMKVRREHVTHGEPTTEDYGENKVGIAGRTVRERIQVVEDLETLPRIYRAFQKGEITWSKARALARVATPENEEEWLDFARGKPVREIEREVQGKKKGSRPKGLLQ